MSNPKTTTRRTGPDDRLIGLQARAALFNLLAQAFNYPDQLLVEKLVSGEFTAALDEALGILEPEAAWTDRIAALEGKYTAAGQDKANLLLELEKDYTRLFFSSKPRLVYLFESVYKEGKLLQESTFEIARLYVEAGLNLVDDFKLPPDHIAVELEFLAYLYYNELNAVKKGNTENEALAQKLQKEALEKHLTNFGLTLAEKVVAHAAADFYKTMAAIAASILAGGR
jgi:TorA maturation chaperone TorD